MDTPEQRIKIAVQKTGRLTEHSLDLLERCGLKFTQSKDQLFCFGENMPIDLLLVRDDDIPGLVADDICGLGIVGLNVVEADTENLRVQVPVREDIVAKFAGLGRATGCFVLRVEVQYDPLVAVVFERMQLSDLIRQLEFGGRFADGYIACRYRELRREYADDEEKCQGKNAFHEFGPDRLHSEHYNTLRSSSGTVSNL